MKIEVKYMINFTNTIGAIGLLLSITKDNACGICICGAMISLRSTIAVIEAMRRVRD